jgi:hypothetical protein
MMKKPPKLKTTSTMAATKQVLRIPRALAAECTIAGLNAPSMRLAIVLASMAYHAPHGQWKVTKPELELWSDVVLDNAAKLLKPLETAVIEKEGVMINLFDQVDYEPGVRFKTAGLIKVRLSIVARDLLYSQDRIVRLPIDELRAYATVPGIILRLRLAARMQGVRTAMHDEWKLEPEDFANPSVFGSYAKIAVIRRENAAGEATEYVSLSRAEAKLLRRGVEEINTRSKGSRVEIVPIRTGDDPKSRWLAIELHTDRIVAGKRRKRTMKDLGRKSRRKQPALADS